MRARRLFFDPLSLFLRGRGRTGFPSRMHPTPPRQSSCLLGVPKTYRNLLSSPETAFLGLEFKAKTTRYTINKVLYSVP